MSIQTRTICDTCGGALTGEHTKVTVTHFGGGTRKFDVHPGACLDRLLARPEIESSAGYMLSVRRQAA